MRAFACVCIAVLVLAACADEAPLRARPTTLTAYPHAMDRLARLERALYSDNEPARVLQAIVCERLRVEGIIGSDVDVRAQLLTDSVESEFTADQKRWLDYRLGGAAIAVGGSECNPFNVEAERELPLLPPTKGGAAASVGASEATARHR